MSGVGRSAPGGPGRDLLAARAAMVMADLKAGLERFQEGRLGDAERLFQKVLLLNPDNPDALHLLGLVAERGGDLERAEKMLRTALRHKPAVPEARSNLGNVLYRQGKLVDAEAEYRAAIALKPEVAASHFNLGVALHDQRRFADAVAAYRTALARDPDNAQIHVNLANALDALDQPDAAVAAYRDALAIEPGLAKAAVNLVGLLVRLEQPDAAMDAIEAALGAAPGEPSLHLQKAILLLNRGDWTAAWWEYEWRLANPDLFPLRPYVEPRWAGDELAGRTLLLYAEQGLGDTLQFARYAALAAARGGSVTLEATPKLHALLATVPGIARVIAPGEPPGAFDCHAPLLSLPGLFGTTPDTIPTMPPYVSVDPALVEAWTARLGAPAAGERVGLAWRGNPDYVNDRRRSLELERLAPLREVAGVELVSLQKGPGGDEAAAPDWAGRIRDMTEAMAEGSLADAAALVMSLDLVIAVDSAIAHLAGALGKPVWILLPRPADWRWRDAGETTAWYPEARLFRQPARGDWDAVVARVAEALAAHARAR